MEDVWQYLVSWVLGKQVVAGKTVPHSSQQLGGQEEVTVTVHAKGHTHLTCLTDSIITVFPTIHPDQSPPPPPPGETANKVEPL